MCTAVCANYDMRTAVAKGLRAAAAAAAAAAAGGSAADSLEPATYHARCPLPMYFHRELLYRLQSTLHPLCIGVAPTT